MGEFTEDKEADVRGLFIDRASFIAGSKPKQTGVDATLLRMMVNNAAGDDFAFEVSDDSLQALLAANNTFEGLNTFNENLSFQKDVACLGTISAGHLSPTGAINMADGVKVNLGTNKQSFLVADSGNNVDLTSDATLDLTGAGLTLQVNGDGINVSDNDRINLGDNKLSYIYGDNSNRTYLISQDNLTLTGSGTSFTLESAQVVITSGRDLKLGRAYQAGAPAATGYVSVLDSAGTTLKLLCSNV